MPDPAPDVSEPRAMFSFVVECRPVGESNGRTIVFYTGSQVGHEDRGEIVRGFAYLDEVQALIDGQAALAGIALGARVETVRVESNTSFGPRQPGDA